MQVYNTSRQPVALGDPVGRGGEASVYKLAVQPALLAKIYHRAPRPDYELKLAWMQANPPDDPTRPQGHASIAWPNDLLYDGNQHLIGYVMVNVQNAVPLLQVFNPRLRARTLPSFNRRYLHRTARNLAAALGALHAGSYVVGDLNESNVMVTPSALVTVIDADSFQVQRRVGAKPILHPCPVGKPEYTPPELQGKTFSETARLPEHDRFGLAVLIFQLLMEGNHPFRAQWLGAGDPPPVEDRIRDGHWPYAAKPRLPLAPPRNGPGLDSLHPEIAALMRQCFIEGHAQPSRRPAPDDWERAIINAEKSLVPCKNNHVYSRHLKDCPECAAQAAAQAATQAAAAAMRASPKQPPPRRAPKPRPSAPRMPPPGPAKTTVPPQTPWPSLPFPWSMARVLVTLLGGAPAPATVTCHHCHRVNAPGEIYCQGCARMLGSKRACPHCGHGAPANAHYCPGCGQRL
jgi:DNA-binding helix-hairpin-helix protein with protein kinase domain